MTTQCKATFLAIVAFGAFTHAQGQCKRSEINTTKGCIEWTHADEEKKPQPYAENTASDPYYVNAWRHQHLPGPCRVGEIQKFKEEVQGCKGCFPTGLPYECVAGVFWERVYWGRPITKDEFFQMLRDGAPKKPKPARRKRVAPWWKKWWKR